jgi:hypothetical protein
MTECPLLDLVDACGIKVEVCHVTGTPCLPATVGASSRHCMRKAWYMDQERHTRNTLTVLRSGLVVPVPPQPATGEISHPSAPGP